MIAGLLGRIARQREKGETPLEGRRCKVKVYALHNAEVFRPGSWEGLKPGLAQVIVKGKSVSGTIVVDSAIAPGEAGDVSVAFNETQLVHPGERLIFVHNDHIGAVGVIESLDNSPQ